MEKKNRNNWIRCGIFLTIAALIIWYLLQVFALSPANENKQIFSTFYKEKENTLDGVYFGSSSATRFWNGPRGFVQEGIAIGSLSAASQPLVITKHLMEEAEKTQNPKIFIVELRWAYKNANYLKDPYIRKTTDAMKFSKTRIDAINAAVDFALKGDDPDVSESRLDYYLPLMKYHGRWDGDLEMEDLLLKEIENKTKGFLMTGSTLKQEPQEMAQYTDEIMPIPPETEEMVLELLDYCDTIDAEVLFVLSPYSAPVEQLQRLNYAIQLVTSRGYPVLNFNTPEMVQAIGLNYVTDFYDSKHTNCLGAEKYTDYLAAYIAENYDIEDHREDPLYESWHEAYEVYEEYTAEGKAAMLKE